jgi:hypothetical protein
VKRGSAKLVEEQQREIGRVSSMYKMYLTKAFGPWLITLLLFVQTGWQTLMLLSDYWLTYETSDSREGSLDPGNFIRVYTLLSLLCGWRVSFLSKRGFLTGFSGNWHVA